ncbi:MAG: hypothetical protein R2784_05300 [Saprospiraceae bacterium]
MTAFYQTRNLVFLFTVLCLTNSSCLKDTFTDIDGTQAGPEIALPIGKVTFKIEDLLENDTLFEVNPDGLLQLSYKKDSATSLKLSTFIDELASDWQLEFDESQAIGNISIDDQTVEGSIKLSQFVSQMNGSIKQFFLNNDGNSIAVPAFNQMVNLSSNLPDFSEFTSINIADGKLTLDVTNEYPFQLKNLLMIIRNRTDNSEVTRFTVAQINPGQTISQTNDLAGKTVSNRIATVVEVFSSNGTGGAVNIDLQSELKLDLTLEDLSISGGRIRPPAYEFDPIAQFVDLSINNQDKIYGASIKSGKVNYEFQSAFNLPLEIDLEFPGILINGTSFKETISFNGSTTGTIDFAGAEIDLTLDPIIPYNRLEVKSSVRSTGTNQLTNFNGSDSIGLHIELVDLDFNSLRGNLGATDYDLEENSFDFGLDLSFLDEESKAIFFKNPEIDIFYKNSFGVPLEASLDVKTYGVFNDSSSLNPPLFVLDYPNINQLGQTISGNFNINKNNSNLVDFLSVYPNFINYKGNVKVKPNSPQEIHFVTPESELTVGFEMSLPMELKASSLIFSDTLTTEAIGDDPEIVESATLVIDFLNDLPFDSEFTLTGKGDSNPGGKVILSGLTVPAADTDNTGKVTGTKATRREIALSRDQINDLFTSNQLEIKVEVSSAEAGNKFVSIYTEDGIQIGLAIRSQLNIK